MEEAGKTSLLETLASAGTGQKKWRGREPKSKALLGESVRIPCIPQGDGYIVLTDKAWWGEGCIPLCPSIPFLKLAESTGKTAILS